VNVEEELRRVIPAIRSVAADFPGIPISIDTVKASVAAEALAAGASIVNDVSGFRLDANMAGVCVRSNAGVVLMHSRGDVADMATFTHADYGEDPVEEVTAELMRGVQHAVEAGVAPARIAIDPGIGFSKRGAQSLAMLRELNRFAQLGFPVLVGVSRKRFIGEITKAASPADRAAGTAGANVVALERGARLFRVHDVKLSRDALDVAWAIMQSGSPMGTA
jgi:dihydropteroate synthase